MRIVVFGANGKVGNLVVQQALRDGFKVMAFVHNKSSIEESINLKVAYGDIYNIRDIENAIEGSDAVISALGSWGTHKKDILSEAMKNIIPTMHKYGVKRIVSLTGSDAIMKNDKLNIISKMFRIPIKLFADKILTDGETHIQLLMNSGLDWTVIRSPIMNYKGQKTSFLLTNNKPLPWETINRFSVVMSIIDLIKSTQYINQAPYIRRR